jgi:predicted AAA+ superfamily ATPase
MIRRVLQKTIEDNLEKQKVTVLTGARRVGKTELLKAIKEKHQGQSLWLNGEDADALSLLAEQSVANYRRLLNGVRLLIIDEAHFVPDIMRKAKLMIDEIRPLHIILTSSSAFTLTQSSGALVGRSMSYTLFPLAQMEFNHHENALETKQNLPDRLIYGSYPELLHLETNREKEFYLKELVNTYMLKDILVFENIRNAQKLRDLLELLARQIGQEVSLDELGRQLALSKNTVERYLELIEKVFIIYRRRGFSRNLRKEIAKSKRWYFFDNGIRNAILNDFRGMAQREDKGMLWENYIASERIKRFAYRQEAYEGFFWRTYDQQEIDIVEVHASDNIIALECKWALTKSKVPVAFAKGYPNADYYTITSTNYLDFVS